MRRRDAALNRLSACRAVLVRRVQRAFLGLLDGGPSTTDPVRAAVPIPEGIDPRLVGAAVRQLAELGLIYRAGLARSVRPEAHGRDLPLWAIADRAGAFAWLRGNPELPEPDGPQARGEPAGPPPTAEGQPMSDHNDRDATRPEAGDPERQRPPRQACRHLRPLLSLLEV
jgi:hypothetical protein